MKLPEDGKPLMASRLETKFHQYLISSSQKKKRKTREAKFECISISDTNMKSQFFSFLRYSLRIFLIQSIGFANWLFDMVRFWSVMVKRKFSSELNKTIFSHDLNLKVFEHSGQKKDSSPFSSDFVVLCFI